MLGDEPGRQPGTAVRGPEPGTGQQEIGIAGLSFLGDGEPAVTDFPARKVIRIHGKSALLCTSKGW